MNAAVKLSKIVYDILIAWSIYDNMCNVVVIVFYSSYFFDFGNFRSLCNFYVFSVPLYCFLFFQFVDFINFQWTV